METILIPIIAGTSKKTKVYYIIGEIVDKLMIDGVSYLQIEDGTEKRYIPEKSLISRKVLI
jgi:hypothetical protein